MPKCLWLGILNLTKTRNKLLYPFLSREGTKISMTEKGPRHRFFKMVKINGSQHLSWIALNSCGVNGNQFYYINCSALASGSKSRKMVSHMCG